MEKLVNYSSDEDHEDNWSKNAAVHAPSDDHKRQKTSENSRSLLGSSSNRNPKEDDRINRNKQHYSNTSSHYRDDYGSSSRASGKMEKTRSKDYRDDRRERKDDYREDRRNDRNDEYRNRDSKNGRNDGRDTKDSKDAKARRGSSGGGDDERKRSEHRQYQHHSSSTSGVSKYRDSRSGDLEKNRPSSDYYRTHRDSNKHDEINDRSDRYRKKRSPSPESLSSSHTKRYSGSSTSNRSDRRYRSRSKSREGSTAKNQRHNVYTSPIQHGSNKESNGGGGIGFCSARPLTTEAAVGLAAAKIAQELRKEISESPPSGQNSPQHSSKQSTAGILGRTEAVVTLPLNHTTGSRPPANLMPLMSVKTSFDNAVTTCAPPVTTPVALPSYYNPNVINPNKYAEQVQKRKLIWGAKKTEDVSAKWGNAKFSEDSDGKVASKFMRLMGIKSAANACESATAGADVSTAKNVSECTNRGSAALVGGAGGNTSGDVKSREAMFSKMEQQYEVARQVTHTMRGVGLGFGSQARQF